MNKNLKNLSIFAAIAMLCCFMLSCRTTKTVTKTEYIHLRDSIVTVDTVYQQVQVGSKQYNTAELSVLQNHNDSLYNALQSANAKLAYQANMLRQGKLNIDTLRTRTDYASAWACVTNNALKLGIIQLPIDTTLTLLQKNTKVTDSKTDKHNESKTIVKTLPFYKDIWFWLSVTLATMIVAAIRLRK